MLAAVIAAPAQAQTADDAPPPPRYQVRDDGTLAIGGDVVVVSCAQIGLEDPYLEAGGPEARACEAAGFGIADEPSPGDVPDSGGTSSSSGSSAEAQALPRTGGSALPALLLAAGMPLAAGCLLVRWTTRRSRRAP